MTTIWEVDNSYNRFWMEGGLWYGYAYNDQKGIFIFDDTGHKSFVDILTSTWEDG
jgi:hypothetical protein